MTDGPSPAGTPASPSPRPVRRRATFVILAGVLAIVGALAAGYYFAMRPVTLRIAVGPANSDDLRATLIRSLAFFPFATAFWALLPLVARHQMSGGPQNYGILLGAIVGSLPRPRLLIMPMVSSLYAVPLVILYPVFTVWLGIGSESKIAFAAIYGFLPTMLSTAAGIQTIDPQLLLAARSMGATMSQRLVRVIIPAARA